MPKEKIDRTEMREQDPAVRKTNFQEVPHGYNEEEARREASRCLQCKKPKCVEGCPVNIDIPGFIAAIEEGRYQDSIDVLKADNALPAVCGRVCPQEEQCEEQCVLGVKGKPVAIGALERYIADRSREEEFDARISVKPANDHQVAVIGAGPAGLTVAGELAKEGFRVTVFEAFAKGGGVLVYGIPEFRLPKAIVRQEIDQLADLGVQFRYNSVMGKLKSIDELFAEGYEAVFIGTGAGTPNFLRIAGENLNGVFSANEYLTRNNLMVAYKFPKSDTPIYTGERVCVIGAGNVAMDAARTAMRLGAANVSIVYRRSRQEAPARVDEIHHAEQEGIDFNFLVNPVAILADDDNTHVAGIRCVRMELGEPDDSGRRRPLPIEGSEFDMPVDLVIVAIGNSPNPLVQQDTPDLKTSRWGTIEVDDETMMTSRPGVFAGGDIVTGAATVILAMGAGKKAARAIKDYLLS